MSERMTAIEALERECAILREGLEGIRGRVNRRLDPSIWHAADSALIRAGVVRLTVRRDTDSERGQGDE